MFIDDLKKLIVKHEGERLDMYQCPAGKWTIGVGHNLEDNGISQAVSDLMFQGDVAESISDAFRFPWFNELTENRRIVIVSMIFNMGLSRFSGFKKTISYIEAGDYASAAGEMLDSKWARQVGHRAEELSQMMEEG